MVRRNYRIVDRPDDRNVPLDIRAEARAIQLETLPPVSKAKYLKRYNDFKSWCESRNTDLLSEESLLVYLRTLRVVDGNAASTLRSVHSMIKACVKVYHNFDIGVFPNVNSYLSNLSRRHIPKKAFILTTQHMNQFVVEAPDIEYFLIKVILIIGVIGCCRKSELKNMLMRYVTLTENAVYINVPAETTKNFQKNSFSIVGPFYLVVRRYLEARRYINNDRFFLTYRNGSFINEAAGDRTIGSVPKKVAEYLGLSQPERYTSHSIRRSSATAYAETGCNEVELMRHGRWQSLKCASGYVEDTKFGKHKVSHLITNAILPSQQYTNAILPPQHQTSIVQYNFNNQHLHMNKSSPQRIRRPSATISSPNAIGPSSSQNLVPSQVSRSHSFQRHAPVILRWKRPQGSDNPAGCSNSTVTSSMLNTSVESSNPSSSLAESHDSFQEPNVAPALQVSTTSTSVNSAVTCAKPTQRARYKLLPPPSSNSNRTLVACAVDVDEELSELFEDDFSYASSHNDSIVTSHAVKPKVISNVLVTPSLGSGLPVVSGSGLPVTDNNVPSPVSRSNLDHQSSTLSSHNQPSHSSSLDATVHSDFQELLEASSDDESVAFGHEDSNIGDSQEEVSHEPQMIHSPNSVQSQHSFDVHGDESLMAETSTPEPPTDASVGVWKNLSEVFGYAPPSCDVNDQNQLEDKEPQSPTSHDHIVMENAVKLNEPASQPKSHFQTKQQSSKFGSSMNNPNPPAVSSVSPVRQSLPRSALPQSADFASASMNDPSNFSSQSRAPSGASEYGYSTNSEADETEYRIGPTILKIHNRGTINIHIHSHPQN
ncbi:hypothetical protein QAD02_006700 [Eretmocerus hayati]|uniref:Uncharacterized protein n=1 Tax=Eretmocerus hayati TaxID=131215 RepID=A0ACC2N220_9HYME|nr:hypothetical protein QAD02_006700 [Eretmocerus hayati]